MPYKVDKIAINNELLDRRFKLTKLQKEEIFNLYESGNYSLNQLGKLYNVSKRTIHLIVKPEKKEVMLKQSAQRQKEGRYYNKKKHAQYMKEHREYKNKLYKEGLINESKN